MEEKTAIAHILKNFIIKKTINTVSHSHVDDYFGILNFYISFQNPIKLVGSMTVAPERIDIVLEKRK